LSAETPPAGGDELRQAEVQRLLAEAVARPPEEREELLAGAASDPGVRDEVLALLAREARLGDFLERPAVDPALIAGEEAAGDPWPGAGAAIGPYRLISVLGEGGMGRVFLAEQSAPVQRRVALKLIRGALASRSAGARFALEQRAMARLRHPNLAQILEAGTTPDGTPYFVMELIEGEPLLAHCDRHLLTVEERLHLFVAVCRGVEHAHRRQILHRDLKPSNVLVAEIDGRLTPKVIDFGIAKALDDSAAAGGLTVDRLIGTLDYMSPEALAGGTEARDLDTRADVYSLGVILFELLTGVLPWAGEEEGLALRIRRLRETDPPAPSTRVSSLGRDGSSEVARRRGDTPAGIRRRLAGDLDWIALKALARDRELRYGSPAELAADIERFLADQPVAARPPSALYVARKTLRRHRAAAVAAALVLAALALGIAGTSVGLLRARRAEARARAEAVAAGDARAEAERVVEFLTGVFTASGPGSAGTTRPPSEVTALELIERAAASSERDLAGEPRIRSRLEATIGELYYELGHYDDARRHLDAALALVAGEEPADLRTLARAQLLLAQVELRLARTAEAGQALERALAASAEGGEREDRRLRADILQALGVQRRLAGDFAASGRYLERSVELHFALDGPTSTGAAVALSNLGNTFFALERWAEAEARFRRAHEILREVLPPGHARLATLTDSLAAAVASQGRLAEAAPIFAAALAEKRRLLGDAHPAIADSLNNLGALHLDLGQPGKAADYHRRALAIREQVLGAEHPRTAWSLDNLARALAELGQGEEARRLQERALAIREAQYGPENVEIARSLDHLADLAVARGDYRAALEPAERSLGITQAQPEPAPQKAGEGAVRLGEILWHLGEEEAARRRFAEGLAILEAGGSETADALPAARRTVAALGAG
jgi:serine/threonine protein kinase/Tfp pilus assembly protein PilF